jgi:hypothetical protein
MSHFTTIQTQIKDIEALRAACAELNLPLLGNSEARGYGGRTEHGDFVIRLQGPYDIALRHQPDGTWGLVADLWDGHVEREVGSNFGRLLQLYGVHKATKEARKRGHQVRRHGLTNGAIKLVIGGI